MLSMSVDLVPYIYFIILLILWCILHDDSDFQYRKTISVHFILENISVSKWYIIVRYWT